MSNVISDADRQQVEDLLGRSPRGLVDIPVKSKSGEPVVIQVASLVDEKPFPTLFWLVDKGLNYAIDQLEASGVIARMQADIDKSPELQAAMAADHQWYIEHRWNLVSDVVKQQIEAKGFFDVLNRRGIGGIENFSRIRCLHTYYASHLVKSNTVGLLIDDYWAQREVSFSHL